MSEYPKRMHRSAGPGGGVEEIIAEDYRQERGFIEAGFSPGATIVPRPDPLDHDEDGRKGGSLPGAQATARKSARRRRR
jgi:hypothetical protein